MEVAVIIKIKAIALFVIAFLNFLLALLVWYRGRTKATLHLGIMALFSGLYPLTLGMIYFTFKASSKIELFWSRTTWIGVLILPAFVTFLYYFCEEKKYLKIKSFLVYITGLIIFLLALFTPFFIEKSNYRIHHYFFTGETTGSLDILGRIYILMCLVIILFNLLRYYFRTQGFKKLQLKYFLFGTIIYAGVGLITVSLLPIILKETADYVEIAAYFSLFWVILTVYAILKYRLMDIRIVLGKGVAYVFSLSTVVGTGVLVAYLNSRLFAPLPLSVVASFIALLSVLLFQLHKFYEKLAARYFYHTFYNTELVITELEERLTQVLDLETLSSLLINTLTNTLKLNKAAILTKETGKKEYIIQRNVNFNEEELNSLIKESPLISYIETAKKLLVREEAAKSMTEVSKKTKELGIEVFLPFIFERKIIGIIILGAKISGEAFSYQDLDLLNSLCNQTSIALKNASLFAEVNKRKEELERFYNLTVGRELKMAELKERIRELEERLKEK